MVRAASHLAAFFLLAALAAPAAADDDVIFIAGFAAAPAEVGDIVTEHNTVRAAVGVGPIFWDESLAATAQAWANTCTDTNPQDGLIDHNVNRSAGHPWYVGENIAGYTGTMTAALAMSVWAVEQADYDYATNTCAPNKVCGHYTQVVWAASVRLGCAVSTCPLLFYKNSMVCNYGPGGNTGGWPY